MHVLPYFTYIECNNHLVNVNLMLEDIEMNMHLDNCYMIIY